VLDAGRFVFFGADRVVHHRFPSFGRDAKTDYENRIGLMR